MDAQGKQGMRRKTQFSIKLRRTSTGEEHVRTILADDEAAAKERAIVRARDVLPLAAERAYEQFEVLSCEVVPRTSARRRA